MKVSFQLSIVLCVHSLPVTAGIIIKSVNCYYNSISEHTCTPDVCVVSFHDCDALHALNHTQAHA